MANIPSASNTAGTAAGLAAILASAPVASGLAGVPLIVSAAAAIGCPPLLLSGLVLGVASLGVNYAVTHWAEAKQLNDLVSEWWPQVVQSYPSQSSPSAVKTPNNLNQS